LPMVHPGTSRCGMICFSEDILSSENFFENYLARLRHLPYEKGKRQE
jgi:hypothetical protein